MKKLFMFLGLLTMISHVRAQSDLFCVRWSTPQSGMVFSQLDLANDTIIDRLSINSFNSSAHTSSTVDYNNSIYYICNGVELWGINTQTDSVILSVALPLVNFDRFTTIQYNPCDSSIYGLILDYNSNGLHNVASYHVPDSVFTTLVALNASFQTGQHAALDPIHNYYLFENGPVTFQRIGAYDMTNNVIVYNTPIQGSTYFKGMAYDCDSNRVLGVEFPVTINGHQISEVNTLTGTLTPLTSSPVFGSTFTSMSGAVLDQTNGNYYFNLGSYVYTGIDASGNYLAMDSLPYPILFLESMSGCTCKNPSSVEEQQASAVTVYPNPFANEFNVTVDAGAEMFLFNSQGQIIVTQKLYSGNNTIDVSPLTGGIYFYRILEDDGVISGSIMKE